MSETNKNLISNQNRTPIEDVLLSVRAKNALISEGYQVLEECQNLSWEKLIRIKNLGKKTVEEILQFLDKFKESQTAPQEKALEKCDDFHNDEKDYLIRILSISLSDVVLSVRATHLLELMRGACLLDLVRKTPEQLLSERDCGVKTVNEINDFLKVLDLRFRMKIPRVMVKEIREYQQKRSSKDILEDFKKSYPEKGGILTSSRLRNVPREKIEYFLRCFECYRQGGTLENAAKKLNLTRERVRQILKKGTSLGLFKYSGHEYPYIGKEKILEDFRIIRSLTKVAKLNNVATSYIARLLTAYKVKDRDLENIRDRSRRDQCIEEYRQIVSELGHHPTTTELQSNDKRRALGVRILRYWGTTEKFREELDIPKFVRTFPEKSRQMLEDRKRLAFIIRMQNLDQIRECLSSSGLMRSSEIADVCGMKPPKALRLLNLLLARGEIIRDGIGSGIKYKINEEA